MKRFLVLLVVVAGGLAAASFSVPTNAAVVNGQAISQNQLNADVTAIANSADYPCYFKAEVAVASQGQTVLPPVGGAGQQSAAGPHTTTPTAFVDAYLDTAVGYQIVLQLASQRHLNVTPAELKMGSAQLRGQISTILNQVSASSFKCNATTGDQVLAEMPASFVQHAEQFNATIIALEQNLSGVGPSTSDQRKFFIAHRSAFDNVSFSVATYASLSAAQTAKALLYEGATFASIASKTTGGGPQGTDVLYRITSQLPASADLQGLPLNTSSDPIAVNGEYVLFEITSRSPTPFASVRADVQQAALSVGAAMVQPLLSAAELHAHVALNPRYGVWSATSAVALAPAPPPSTDVRNAGANLPFSVAIASSSSGQSG